MLGTNYMIVEQIECILELKEAPVFFLPVIDDPHDNAYMRPIVCQTEQFGTEP